MLRPWDTAASRLLNPYGKSDVLTMTPSELWKCVSEGSQMAHFHSELAATDETGGNYRVGIGLSRFAETLLVAIDSLDNQSLSGVLVPEALERTRTEAREIAPNLKILAVGKGRQPGADSSGFGFGKSRKLKSKWK